MDGEKKIEEDELVGSPQEQRNWRGILIAVLVIVIVLSLIVTAVIIVSPKHEEINLGEFFTFDDLFNHQYQPRQFSAEWIGDDEVFVYRTREGEVMEYDASTNTSTIIMDNSTFRQLNTDWFLVSPDRHYVLLAFDRQQVYRHSFLAEYKIYHRYAQDPNSRLLPFPRGNGDWVNEPLQYAGWSAKYNSLTFIFRNNLYYQADPDNTPNWVTNDGEGQKIFNGIPDWVYEEEILHSNKAHWWSPENSYICYARFDDSNVPIYSFPYYGPGDNIYGSMEEFAYPKAGDRRNGIAPRFSLFIMTPNSGTAQKEIRPPANLGSDFYFTQVAWQDDEHVMITWSNRAQNYSIYTICSANDADCSINQIETTHEGKGWVETTKPLFLRGRYLVIHPEQDATYGFWKHIAMVTTPLGSVGTRTYVTQGTWDVMELLTYDADTGYIYFISTNRDPRKRHLFRVGIVDSNAMSLYTPECLTCDYSEDCQYVSATFSRSAKFYILHCKGPGVPQHSLRSTMDNRNIVMEDNRELRNRLAKKALPIREYHEIDVGNGIKVRARVDLPPVLNKKHLLQYPMLVHTYGGPGTQQVTMEFSIGWSTYISSSKKVIYVSVDGRGTSGRGDRWLHSLYGNLGTLEVQDQIKAAQHLRDSFVFVDPDRIAIWGWSYGGFVTLHALGDSESDVFTCGVAVAPVTDWHYYDTAYTERYMGLERDNYKGYDNANISWKADNFRGKNLLLIHGTADDNVHFQNTAQFIKALTMSDIDFRIQIYSDKNHALMGKPTSRHMHRTMARFLQDTCWGGGEPHMQGEEGPEAA